MGISGLRRGSRSPRSQRSRSADVDCLKKYSERRIEDRRHTEVADPNKVEYSKWDPLPQLPPRDQPIAVNKRLSKNEQQESLDNIESTVILIAENRLVRTESEVVVPPSRRPPGIWNHSTDVTCLKSDKAAVSIVEQRRHTECSDPRIVATRYVARIIYYIWNDVP